MKAGRRRGAACRRGVSTLVALLVAVDLAGAALVMAPRGDVAPAPRLPRHPPSARLFSGPASPGLDAHADRFRAVRDLLARRSRAVLAHDRRAFLATVDPQSPTFTAAQARLFDALSAVPLATWGYRLEPAGELPLPPAARARYAAVETWSTGLTLRYRLGGFDAADALLPQRVTFVRRARGWLLGGDGDFAPTGGWTSRGLWDFGPVRVVRGARSLVLGHPSHAGQLRALAREADAAVPRVTAVWGHAWSQRVVLVVPDSQRELLGLLGQGGDLHRIAALATAESEGARVDGADRVLVNPAAFGRLTALGRRVVLTHEATHVATRAATGTGTPSWLAEGFADYVGYRGARVRVGSVAPELRDEVRAGHLPAALPTDADFAATNPWMSQAYEMAWLACRMIARRWGEPALVRLYRAIGAASAADDSAAVATGVRAVLGTDVHALTAAWREQVRTELR